MDRARIKTFILFLLAVVNLIFLALIGIDRIQTVRLISEARTELIWALDGMGIHIDYEAIPDWTAQTVYVLSRDIERETEVASGILGTPMESQHVGGGIYRWLGPYGEGHTRLSSFWFDLADQGFSGPRADTEELLRQMGLTAQFINTITHPNHVLLMYILTIDDGLPVLGSQISFHFSGDYLQAFGGTMLWGTRQGYTVGQQLDVTTALIALGGHLQDHDISRFYQVEIGYYLVDSRELRPVWVVTTDGGIFSVDRLSGEIR